MQSERLSQLDRYAARIADIQLERNPLASEVMLIFNLKVRDQYQDTIVSEDLRIKKRAMVSKNVDMNYVQQFDEAILLEDDTDKIPWIVSMTTTQCPRIPSMDDNIIIEGIKYSISMVKPANRNINSLILLLIYPERSFSDDGDVRVLSHKILYKGSSTWDLQLLKNESLILDLIYGGDPKFYSFDSVNWYEFESQIVLNVFEYQSVKGTIMGLFYRNIDKTNVLLKLNSHLDENPISSDLIVSDSFYLANDDKSVIVSTKTTEV